MRVLRERPGRERPAGGNRARRFGIAGAVAGIAAAGVAAGVAVERALIRRSKRDVDDPYADERFGELPCEERRTVTASDGTELLRGDRRASIPERGRPAGCGGGGLPGADARVRAWVLPRHGRLPLSAEGARRAGRIPHGLLRPAGSWPVGEAAQRRVRAACAR